MKKIVITVILLVIVGLGIMNFYSYYENQSLKQAIANLKKEPATMNEVNVMTELTGNLISFDQNKKAIEMFSKELNKNIIVTYNNGTIFYLHEIMSDERYQKALANYEEKTNETNKKMKESNDGQLNAVILPQVPLQDVFNQMILIDNLNITKDDQLIVPFNGTNSAGQYIAINIIKNSFINQSV